MTVFWSMLLFSIVVAAYFHNEAGKAKVSRWRSWGMLPVGMVVAYPCHLVIVSVLSALLLDADGLAEGWDLAVFAMLFVGPLVGAAAQWFLTRLLIPKVAKATAESSDSPSPD